MEGILRVFSETIMQDILELKAQNINLTWLFDLIFPPKHPFSPCWIMQWLNKDDNTTEKKRCIISHGLSSTQHTSHSRFVLFYWLILCSLPGNIVGGRKKPTNHHSFYGYFSAALVSKQALSLALVRVGKRLGERAGSVSFTRTRLESFSFLPMKFQGFPLKKINKQTNKHKLTTDTYPWPFCEQKEQPTSSPAVSPQ